MTTVTDATQEGINRVHKLESEVLEGRKHANNIVILHELVKSNVDVNQKLCISAMQAVKRIFVELSDRGEVTISVASLAETQASAEAARASKGRKKTKTKKDSDDGGDEDDKESATEVYQKWLKGKFRKFLAFLFELIHIDSPGIQAASIHALMTFVAVEANNAVDPSHALVDGLYGRIIKQMVTSPFLDEAVLTQSLSKFICNYVDLQYYTLRNLRLMLDGEISDLVRDARRDITSLKDRKAATNTTMANIFALLLRLKVAKDNFSSTFPTKFLVESLEKKSTVSFDNDLDNDRNNNNDDDDGDNLVGGGKRKTSAAQRKGQSMSLRSAKEHFRAVSNCWLAFLRLPLSVSLYKAVLVRVHEHIIPQLVSPLDLADFLTDSYNVGGVISILALNGLFILVTQHELEYPQFYPKLYCLCTAELFHAKYKFRFFKLVDLFLSSPHLPSYMAAAFAKRFARLALHAPPSGGLFALALIHNLLNRHASIAPLMHRPPKVKFTPFQRFVALLPSTQKKEAENGGVEKKKEEDEEEVDLGVDPYNHNDDNLDSCGAIDSSLWEVKALCNHYNPAVARAAQLVGTENASKKELNIEDVIASSTYDAIFQKESAWRSNQAMPLSHYRPAGLFKSSTAGNKLFRF